MTVKENIDVTGSATALGIAALAGWSLESRMATTLGPLSAHLDAGARTAAGTSSQ